MLPAIHVLEIFHGGLLRSTSRFRMMYKQHGTTVIFNLLPGDNNDNAHKCGCCSVKSFRFWESKKDSGDHVYWGLITPPVMLSLSVHIKYDGQTRHEHWQRNLVNDFSSRIYCYFNVASWRHVWLCCVHSRSLSVLFAHPSLFLTNVWPPTVPELESFLGHHCGCDSSHTGENGMTFTRAVRR